MKKLFVLLLILVLSMTISGCGKMTESVVYETIDDTTYETGLMSNSGWGEPVIVSDISTDINSEMNPVFDPYNSNVLYFSRSTKNKMPGDVPYAYRVWRYDFSTGVVTDMGKGLENINNWAENGHTDTSVKPIGISPDGKKLYLRSSYEHHALGLTGVENIWVSSRTNINGDWQTPVKVEAFGDNSKKETNILFTSELKAYIVKTYSTGMVSGNVYWTQQSGETWLTPAKDVNNEMSLINDGAQNIYSLVLDPLSGGKSGFVTCALENGGVGSQDIYYMNYSDSSNKWIRGANIVSSGMNNGLTINSADDDVIFSISPDGLKMVIFSNRNKPNTYKYDIFVVTRENFFN